MKVCKTCNEEKPLTEFRLNKGKYYEGSCKSCRYQQMKNNPNRQAIIAKYRASDKYDSKGTKYRLAKYGLSEEDYTAMIDQAGGVCEICKQPEVKNKDLSIDHDHATLAVRGILCDNCNTVLGRVKDSVSHLEAMIEYLRNHS